MRFSSIATVLVLSSLGCSDGGSETEGEAGGGGSTANHNPSSGNHGSGSQAGSGGGDPSGGCSASAAATGVTSASIDVGGTPRNYTLYVPEGYDGKSPLKLVFVFHGLGSNGAEMRGYTGPGLEGPAAGTAIFVYPDGLPVDGGTGWELSPDNRDLDFYDALLASLTSDYCIDSNRVFATGFSFGGYMSNAVGCFRGNTLRAIAPVAGGGPFGECQGPIASMVIHGSGDLVVLPVEGEKSRDQWLALDGCAATSQPVEPSPCQAYDGCQEGKGVTYCQHEGVHEWPSFAGAAVWGFFQP